VVGREEQDGPTLHASALAPSGSGTHGAHAAHRHPCDVPAPRGTNASRAASTTTKVAPHASALPSG